MKQQIIKTIVGSLPRFSDSLEIAIRKAIDFQLEYGIDILTDGEQRGDMISYFEQIPGLTLSNGKLGITGKIGIPKNVNEFDKFRDYIFAKKYIDHKKIKSVGFKVAITGPTTLGFTCATTKLREYSSVTTIELYRDITLALQPLIDELLRLNAYVQIDEPGISARFIDPNQSVKLINQLVNDLTYFKKGSGKLSVHICGDIARTHGLFENLIGMNVDILSFAFGGKTESGNVKLLSNNSLIDSPKKIGFGCTSVSPSNIDSIDSAENIVKVLNIGINKIGLERIAYVHPNCGLKNTPLEVAREILNRMRISTNLIKQ